MFTGLIRHQGMLRGLQGKSVSIGCPTLAGSLSQGDSVAVNGICLTVSGLEPESFSADLLDETLAITAISSLQAGAALNLETALRMGDSLGGHILSGHVEGTGLISSAVLIESGDCVLTVTIPARLNNFLIQKGSIAIDGVSLTIQEVLGNDIIVNLIPETLAATSLGNIEEGSLVNIETDMMVRNVHHSVERILAARDKGN